MKSSVTNARKSVLIIFFINGFVLSSWIPHIPLVKEQLNIGEGLLGLALLAIGIGAILFMPLSGLWSERYGSRIVTSASIIFACLILPLPIIAPNFITLIATLFLFGSSNGVLDVAMNSQAVIVEEKYKRPIMSSFHGLYSLGGLFGAGIGGLALENGISPNIHVITISIVSLIITLFTIPYLLPKFTNSNVNSVKFIKPEGAIWGLGILTFLALLAEGSIADWSSLYIKSELKTTPGIAAMGFAAFSLTMAIGRLSGDIIVAKIGEITLVRIMSIIAVLGLGLALIANLPYLSIIGFGIVGIGLSNLIPVMFSSAGKIPAISPSIGIAAVATTGYFGLLAGPPVIGFIAELLTLKVALWIVVLAIFIVGIFARLIKPERQ